MVEAKAKARGLRGRGQGQVNRHIRSRPCMPIKSYRREALWVVFRRVIHFYIFLLNSFKSIIQIRRRTAASCALVHEVEVLYGGIESFTY